MYGYIYLTTCSLTGKSYVGHHKWSQEYTDEEYMMIPKETRDAFYKEHGFRIFPIDLQYYGSGKALIDDIKLLGKQNFTVNIIDKAETRQECLDKETYWINKLMSEGVDVYNNIAYGNTGFDIDEWSVDDREAYRARCRKYAIENNSISYIGDCSGRNNGRYGKPVSAITRSRISNANRGRKQSSEEREMRRTAHMNKCPNIKPPNCKGRIHINNGQINRFIYPDELSNYPGWSRGIIRQRHKDEQ